MRSPGRHRRSKRAPSLPRVGMALAVAVALLFIAPASTGGAQVLPPPRFRDVADQLPFETDVHSWDIDVGRLDADAVPDVVISYHGFIVFYRLIRPSFVRVFRRPGNDPHACAIGDVDDDGMGDVLCTRGAALGTIRKRNHLWMQTHPGRFRDSRGALRRAGSPRSWTSRDVHRPEPRRLPGSVHRERVPAGGRAPLAEPDVSEQRRSRVPRGSDRCHAPTWGGVRAGGRPGPRWVAGSVALRAEASLPLPEPSRPERGTAAPRCRPPPRHRSSTRDVRPHRRPRCGRSEDLLTVQASRLLVFPGRRGGGFAAPRLLASLTAGRWVTWGNLDGRRGPDLFVVQTCEAGRNIRDLVLLDRGPGWDYASGAHVPQASGGCGDLGATLDIDGDGTDEVIVLNGVRGLPPEGGIRGPVQVLTSGPFP